MAKDAAVSGSAAGDMLWYVLKVQTNRERTIREALLKKIRLEVQHCSTGLLTGKA